MKKIIKSIKKKIKIIINSIFYYFCSKKIIKIYKSKNNKKLLDLKMYYLNALKEKDINKFKQIKKEIENLNISRIKNQEKVKIGFILYTTSMWSCDKLYKYFKKNERYEPYILVCEFNDSSKESRRKNYDSTLQYFNQNNYNVIGINEKNLGKLNQMDVLFYLNPFKLIPDDLNIEKLPLKMLTIYISYSFMIADRSWKFDLPMYQLTWKYFADSLIYKNLIKANSKSGGDNVEFCGYIRMDEFYTNDKKINDDLWKIPENSKNKIYKIIYAPHHSVFDAEAGFSTFDQNYMFIYNLAKKYKNTTSWIIKPHPLLRGRITRNGFFKNVEEYDKYLSLWDELPNAKVITDGTYFDIFKTSDTMILDSVSFLAEYQYVHKPLLFLTRDTQGFNLFGDKLKKVLYCCDGDDFTKIENYLNDVVINENDSMKKNREEFFEKYLDYYKQNNNKLASEFIYEYFEEVFIKENGENNETQ